MKLIFLFVLYFFASLNRAFSGQSNVCMDQTYDAVSANKLRNNYWSEFSTLKYWKRKLPNIFGSKHEEVPYKINDEMAKELCACAIHKKKDNVIDRIVNLFKKTTAPSFEDILKEIQISRNDVVLTRWYGFIPITYTFPTIACMFDNEICAILKGLKQKFDGRPVYDIYVLDVSLNEKQEPASEFVGVIKKVDLELSNQKPKTEDS